MVRWIANAFKHLHKIRIHRKWVRKYCFKAGLYWQGLTHDLSKYSPTEFFESVKYYQGTSSPIDACKKAKGYSMAWFHHRGRNKHHHEMWTDNYDKGTTYVKMPWKYAVEMVCDYLGAGIAYSGGIKCFSLDAEIEWWSNKRKTAAMHPATIMLVDKFFEYFKSYGIDQTFKEQLVYLRQYYDYWLDESNF